MMFVFAIAVLFGVVQSRAVNISNTWMLPEEGFPVFYRYFRDRISWYEADAVCQFHHANLVTADSSSQYDAIRAYLKELDIKEKVWIGLSKTSEKPNFIWTDFRPLSGEGHWQEALPAGESQSLCAVMDPGADFLWRPLPCGGPEVAAFICELPIPSWALGPKGCLLTELPSLTVLYIPEQSALELTSDCGLDGTKRIACKGNADREEILRQLTCVIYNEDMDEDKSTKTSTLDYYETSTSDENSLISRTPKTWTFNTISVDYGMPTRHRRETEDTLSPVSTKSSFKKVATTDLSWTDTHREKTVLTTQHIPALDDHITPTSATSFNIDKTTDGTTNAARAPTLDSSISDRVSFGENVDEEMATGMNQQASKMAIEQRTTEKVITTKQHTRFTTVTSKVSEVSTINTKDTTEKLKPDVIEGTSSTTTQEENAEEYPSAINQGQLFSIIENGTMFDIIELNETEQEPNNKTRKPFFTIATTTPASTIETGHETAYSFTIGFSAKESMPTKKYNTKKPLQPTKKYSKDFPDEKMIFKNDKTNTTTQKPMMKIQSVDQIEENLTKEFEMMPDFKDASIKLNRTFRKELPPIIDENTGLESGSQFGVPRILNFSITNAIDFGDEGYQQDQGQQNITETIVLSEKVEIKTESVPANKIDPKIDAVSISNENINPISTAIPQVEPNASESLTTKLKVHEIFQSKIDMSHENMDPIKEKSDEAAKVAVRNPIDPRIYMLNHHPDVQKNNESESVVPIKTRSSTEESLVAKEEYLPKSLLGEKNLSAESTKQTSMHPGISDAYTEHPFPSDEPKKMNRHRSLHTNKQRKFYPYFFSRMLG